MDEGRGDYKSTPFTFPTGKTFYGFLSFQFVRSMVYPKERQELHFSLEFVQETRKNCVARFV